MSEVSRTIDWGSVECIVDAVAGQGELAKTIRKHCVENTISEWCGELGDTVEEVFETLSTMCHDECGKSPSAEEWQESLEY